MSEFVFGTHNAAFVQVMYEQYLRDPQSVGEEWRQLFDNGRMAELPVIPTSREEVLRETGSGKRETETVPVPPPGLTPLTGAAARLAQNMADSLSVPTATSFRDIAVDMLDAQRKLLNGAPAKVMTLSSTYDHRVIQGAESGLFLRRLEGLLQGEDNFYGAVLESLGLTGVGTRETGNVAVVEPTFPVSRGTSPDDLRAVAAAMALVKAIRHFGHLAARPDPLGSEPPGDPALDPAPLGLTSEIMARIPADVLRISVPGATLDAD